MCFKANFVGGKFEFELLSALGVMGVCVNKKNMIKIGGTGVELRPFPVFVIFIFRIGVARFGHAGEILNLAFLDLAEALFESAREIKNAEYKK